MSLDRSLKAGSALIRHRNVLTRTERLAKLDEEERFKEGDSVFGLPKVAHRSTKVGKKTKEKKEGEEEGAKEAEGAKEEEKK